MRFAVLLAAIAAFFLQTSPAKAVTGLYDAVELQLSGVVDVTRTRFACDGVVSNCGPIYERFALPWSKSIIYPASVFADGGESFEIGGYYASGVFTGLITYLGNGLFTGSNLTYAIDGGMRNCAGSIRCYAYSDYGTEASFRVVALRGAVPEPATWGLMLIGFAVIGAALRRSRGGLRGGLRALD